MRQSDHTNEVEELTENLFIIFKDAHPFLAKFRSPEFVASLAQQAGPLHLDGEMEMVADTFRSFAEKVIKPHAEHVHRHNADVPEEIVQGLAEMGA